MTELTKLWNAVNEIISELDDWILKTDGKEVRLRFKPIDQVRLLKLRVWETRYKLSIEEIMDLIMPILRYHMLRKKTSYGLGVSVRSFTGTGAERILIKELEKTDPDGQHEEVWRQLEQETQLEAEAREERDGLPAKANLVILPLDVENTQDWATWYQGKIERRRNTYRELIRQEWRKRKNYRGNPWI